MTTDPPAASKAVAEYSLSWNNIATEQCSNLNLERLKQDQIHLWMVSLGGFMVREKSSENRSSPIPFASPFASSFENLLTQAEHQRGQRIVNHMQRKHYLGGRIGLRILLSAYARIASSALRFGYGSRGKPRLLNAIADGELAFNYTLSGGHALYAFAWNRQLGVDLEIFPRAIASAGLAKRILSKAEQIAWKTLGKQQHEPAMLACWTRKEAYGKTLGVGIRYTMNQVDLFTDLQRAEWRTKRAGLFDESTCQQSPQLRGVQLALPVGGVASLMYAENQTDNEEHNNNPTLLGFQLH